MAFTKQWISFGKNNAHQAYFASPASPTLPIAAVIVVQEIWGVDGHIQNVTERFAQAGYAAVAPDLFAHAGKRPQQLSATRLSETQNFINSLEDPMSAFGPKGLRQPAFERLPEANQARIEETFTALITAMRDQFSNWVETLRQTVAYLKKDLPMVQGQKIGCVGFCVGGALTQQLACVDPALAAAVSFYGQSPQDALLEQAHCPILAFYGDLDKPLTDHVDHVAKHMKRFGKFFEPHVYGNTDHAFFNDTRPTYQVRSARDAYARTLGFLNQHL